MKEWVGRKHRGTRVSLVLGFFILALLVAGSWALAQEPADSPPEQADAGASTVGWGDDGLLEVGVEWINDFPGTQDDRSHWDESCDGLYNKLVKAGWTKGFHWTDWDAWEQDFKRTEAPGGGTEEYYADNVDIAMVCTHGSGAQDAFWNLNLSSVYFGSTHDDHDLSPGDAYKAYGDKDLEWLAFDSCSVLSDGGPAPYYNRGYWAATMNGLHLLLGFSNTMYVWAPGDGYKWADYLLGWKPFSWLPYLRPPYRVAQAWFAAVDDVQPNVTCARVLAQVQDNYNDYLWGKGYVSPDPIPGGTYWYWDHCSTNPGKRSVEQAVVAETMPVLRVSERPVDPGYVLERIAPAFSMPGRVVETDERYLYMVDYTEQMTRTLQVDLVTGGYKFLNLAKLWVVPETPPSLPPTGEAEVSAELFLLNSADTLPGVQNLDWMPVTTIEAMVGVELPNPDAGVRQEQIIDRVPMDISVTYGRQPVAAGVQTAAGPQTVEFPIVGPGARTRVYVGEGGEILGAQGGGRDYVMTGDQVRVLSAEEVWNRFVKDPTIALPQVPWIADRITRDPAQDRLGYYELPHLQGQQDLIPVWIFEATYSLGRVALAENVQVQVPAAEEYWPPLVKISSPVDGSGFLSGQAVELKGGVEQNGVPPFQYEWSSSVDGPLGGGEVLTATLTAQVKAGDVLSNTISLQVTDANGQQGGDSVTIVVHRVYLPLVMRNH